MGFVMNLDLTKKNLSDVNYFLQHLDKKSNERDFVIKNPLGSHALCAGLQDEMSVTIKGHVGYYCAGMNKNAHVTVEGNVGTGVAENMMSGKVHVKGNASQSAGASGNGGTLIIDGDASSRCGISMKGIDIIVKGSVGHMSAFMAQSGNLVILGDADEYLGDSIYEAKIYCMGKVKSLGADCVEKEMKKSDIAALQAILDKNKVKADASKFKRYGSERKLYHFKIDNVGNY